MKKTTAISNFPSLNLPRIRRTLRNNFRNQRATKQSKMRLISVLPPTEERIELLNRIGQEYPFCVYYKQKANDPL